MTTSTTHVFERLHNAGLRSKVKFCRELLDQLRPDSPPRNCRPREFLWQYRALYERLSVYEQLLNGTKDPLGSPSTALQRAELALDNSLNYFKGILAPDSDDDENDDW